MYRIMTEYTRYRMRRVFWLLLYFIFRFRIIDRRRHVSRVVRFLGCRFTVPDTASFVWQFKDIFVDELYAFAPRDSEPPVIYDCGANIGMSVLYFKRLFPNSRITAFEADPQLAAVCTENLKMNNTLMGVTVVPKAVWVDAAGVSFATDGADGGTIHDSGAAHTIESVRLREYLIQEPHIDMLKIDIEGAEVAVLSDCADALAHVDHLFVEYHAWVHEPQQLSKLLAVLEGAGFRYTITHLHGQTRPFMQQIQEVGMDVQLNIFARRV